MKKEKQYEAIEKMMERVREAFGAEHKIARMFEIGATATPWL